MSRMDRIRRLVDVDDGAARRGRPRRRFMDAVKEEDGEVNRDDLLW